MRVHYVRHGEYYDTYVPDGENYLANGVWNHNTGKSYSLMQRVRTLCKLHPGSRHVFARDKRSSLTESVLPDWETEVLWPGHPAIGRQKRSHRPTYVFPNGSTVILHSLENVDRILSAQFDTINVFQAEELRDEQIWEKMATRLRWGRCPYPYIVGDVNPASVGHFLNVRADRKICWPCSIGIKRPDEMPTIIEMEQEWGAPICPLCHGKAWKYQMQRILYRHEDNPRWYDHERKKWKDEGKDYIGNTLGRLSGVQRERLLKHRWVSEAGVILDEWDPKVHIIDGQLYPPGKDPDLLDSPFWRLHVKDREDDFPKPVTLVKFGAGVDWGFHPDPGVISVWGYDDQGRRFLVEEVGRLRQQIEWWAEEAHRLKEKYQIDYFACDPARNDNIEAFNRRMSPRFGRSRPIAVKANNRMRSMKSGPGRDLVGIDLMRWGLRDPEGVTRTFLLRESMPGGVDKELSRTNRPTCTAKEVPSWVYAKNQDGKDLETPQKGDDHFLDSWRYEVSIGWLSHTGLQEMKATPRYGTIRSLLWSTYEDD